VSGYKDLFTDKLPVGLLVTIINKMGRRGGCELVPRPSSDRTQQPYISIVEIYVRIS